MSCCGGNCGCGANCKCGSGCRGCKMYPDIVFGEKTVESTGLQATASDIGSPCEATSVAGESGQGSSGGSGCSCNPCNCNPCNCK